MKDVLFAVLCGVLPAVAAALLLFGVAGKRCLGLSIGIALFGAFGLLDQVWPILPHELYQGGNQYQQWLCWSAVVAGLLGFASGPGWFVMPMSVLLIGAEIWLMLTNRRGSMALPEIVITHGLAFVLVTTTFLALRRIAERRDGIGIAFAICVLMSVDAGLLGLGGSWLLAQLAGTTAAVMATALLTALWHRPFLMGAPSMLAVTVVHGGLLLAGYFFSDMRAEVAVLAAGSPVTLLLAGGGAGRSGWRFACAVLAMSSVLYIAVLLSLR
ncbi:MAG: hypothetical protein WCR59_11090 [Planctomycetota bacterium]